MRLVLTVADCQGKRLKREADASPIYAGNVSALVRSAIAHFFHVRDAASRQTAGLKQLPKQV